MPMPKKLISLRISDSTKRQLDSLCAAMNDTQAGVIALAIDRLATQVAAEQVPAVLNLKMDLSKLQRYRG